MYLKNKGVLTPEAEFVKSAELLKNLATPSVTVLTDSCVGNSGDFVDISPLSDDSQGTLDNTDIEFMRSIIWLASAS
jgi:hypothetical protein